VSIVGVASLGLKGHVPVLGSIPGGLPSIAVPSVPLRHVAALAGTALTVAFVCVVQTAATARSLSSGGGATETLDRDLVGVGAANLVTGVIGSFPVNASPPRSAVVAAAGGRSQVASIVAAAATLAVVAFATGLFGNLPQATLGAILIFVATRLLHLDDLKAILRFERVEFGLALVTMAIVAVFGIEAGVVAALVLALVDRTRLSARPRDVILAREIGTDHWIPTGAGHPTERVPGVIVYLPLAPIWFGNAQYISDRIRNLVDSSPDPVRAVVFDAAGVSDIDFTGARALDGLVKELRQRGIKVGVARASGLVPEDIRQSELLADLGPDHIYSDVESAVRALTAAK